MPALQEQTRGEKKVGEMNAPLQSKPHRSKDQPLQERAGLKPGGYKTKSQRRSKMPAAPMPPPMHMVTMP